MWINRIEKFLNLDIGDELKLKIANNSTFSSMQLNEKTNYSWEVGSLLKEQKFLRKGKVGDWVNYLNKKQSDEVEDMANAKLLPLGAKIRYVL